MILMGLSRAPGSAEGLQKEVQEAPRETLRVLACCQALIQVDGELVGDPLERAAFLAAGTHTSAEGDQSDVFHGHHRLDSFEGRSDATSTQPNLDKGHVHSFSHHG